MTEPDATAATPASRFGELLALAVVLAIALAALALALRYPLWEYVQPGPGLFPALAAGLSVLCAAAVLVAALLARPSSPAEGGVTEYRRLAVYVLLILAWVASFATLGFVVSSLVALALLLRLGEGMRWPVALAIALLIVGLGWGLFERLLGVPLPHGILPG